MTKPPPLRLSGTILLLLLTILMDCGPAMAASNAQSTPSGIASGWGYADIDGDHKPDLVELRRTSLELRMSSGKELHLASLPEAYTPGVEIVVVDLDGDHDPDIVIRNRFLRQRSDIWINDGDGFFRKSATREFSFPIERGSWNPSPTLDPGTAVTVKYSKPLAIADDAWFLPPSSGRSLHNACGVFPAQDHTDTAHLRGPPIPSFR